jgi:DedD protein
MNGVPSTLETRVQVGPFKTRQEAEAAQAKLKALGIESLLVPPKGGR